MAFCKQASQNTDTLWGITYSMAFIRGKYAKQTAPKCKRKIGIVDKNETLRHLSAGRKNSSISFMLHFLGTICIRIERLCFCRYEECSNCRLSCCLVKLSGYWPSWQRLWRRAITVFKGSKRRPNITSVNHHFFTHRLKILMKMMHKWLVMFRMFKALSQQAL